MIVVETFRSDFYRLTKLAKIHTILSAIVLDTLLATITSLSFVLDCKQLTMGFWSFVLVWIY